MIAFMNLLVLVIGAGVFYAARRLVESPSGWAWGLAWIAFVVVHQIWHKRRYGRWFDGPLIKEGVAPASAPELGVNKLSEKRGV